MEKILRCICNYFSKNILSVLYAAGLLLGAAVLFNYYSSIHYLPPVDTESIIYIILIASISGVIFIIAMSFLVGIIGLFARALLPETMQESFQGRLEVFVRVFSLPQLVITLTSLWLMTHEVFDRDILLWVVYLLPVIGALVVFLFLSMRGWKNNKLLVSNNIMQTEMNFLRKGGFIVGVITVFCVNYFMSVMFFLLPALMVSPHIIRPDDGMGGEFLGSALIAFFLVFLTLLVAASVRDFPSGLNKKNVSEKEMQEHVERKKNSNKSIIFVSFLGFSLFGLSLFLPIGFGGFLAGKVVHDYNIAADDADILVNQEGCSIVNEVAPLYVKKGISPGTCKISGVKILSSLGSEYFLSVEDMHTDFYVVPAKENIDFSKIKGNAVILIGHGEKRDAYLVRHGVLMMKGKEDLVIKLYLSDVGKRQLDFWQPGLIVVNLENRTTVNQLLRYIKSKASFWDDDEKPYNFKLPKVTVLTVVTSE